MLFINGTLAYIVNIDHKSLRGCHLPIRNFILRYQINKFSFIYITNSLYIEYF